MKSFKTYLLLTEKPRTLNSGTGAWNRYNDSYKIKGWENPSISEIQILVKKHKILRFIVADKGKRMLMWRGHDPAIHLDIAAGEQTGNPDNWKDRNFDAWGMIIHRQLFVGGAHVPSSDRSEVMKKEIRIEMERSGESLILKNRVMSHIKKKYSDTFEWHIGRLEY